MSAAVYTCLLLMQVTGLLALLPPIEKCQLNDTLCVRSSAQDVLKMFASGIPEVGSEGLDPIHIDIIKIDLSGLKLTVRDSDIIGLRNSIIDKLSINMAKKQMQFAYHSGIVLKGKYKAGGRLLILPISGDGDIIIKIKNLELFMTMPFEIVKNKDGKDVIELKSFKFTFENRENTHFRLTNLFNGNKPLSDTMHTFMNENWQAISKEFGNPMLEKPLQKVFIAIKTYLKSQPLEDIAEI